MRGTGLLAMLSGALLWGCAVPGVPERSPEPSDGRHLVLARHTQPSEDQA